jgi:hypothetical protein
MADEAGGRTEVAHHEAAALGVAGLGGQGLGHLLRGRTSGAERQREPEREAAPALSPRCLR